MAYKFENCPRCNGALDIGFAHRNTGLSFVAAEKLEQFAFVDEDLGQSPLWAKICPAPAQYFRSYACRECQLYLVDYAKSFDNRAARRLAAAILVERDGEGGDALSPRVVSNGENV